MKSSHYYAAILPADEFAAVKMEKKTALLAPTWSILNVLKTNEQ